MLDAITEAGRSKLLGSLATILATDKTPLVELDPAAIDGLIDAVTTHRQQRFRRLAEQSFPTGTAPQARRILRLDPRQAPNRKFGFEAEGHLPSDSDGLTQIFDVTKILKALGLPCGLPGLPKVDKKYDDWRVVVDSSVVNPLNATGDSDVKSRLRRAGVEVVAPILEGAHGATVANSVLDTMRIALRTNETCGFHLHCDLEGVPFDQIRNLAVAFVRNEEKIDRMISPDRRGSNSRFAQSVAHVGVDVIMNTHDLDELVELMNHGDRNSKFDITKLANPRAPQTVQYRAEGGAGYLDSAFGYTILMVNFTEDALKNPHLDVDELCERLTRERALLPQTEPAGPDMTVALSAFTTGQNTSADRTTTMR